MPLFTARNGADFSSLDRRGFLATAGMGALALGACNGITSAVAKAPSMEFGLQLYTLGEDLASDPVGYLEKVREIGYTAIEGRGAPGLSRSEFLVLIRRLGLKVPSMSVAVDGTWAGDQPNLDTGMNTLVEDALELGARWIVMPAMKLPDNAPGMEPGEAMNDWIARAAGLMTADDWKMNADFLNSRGEIAARAGLRMAYHNHNMEFAPLGDTTPLQILLDNTDRELVDFEMDTGWVVAAGHDCQELLASAPGRFRLMHVKDIKPSTKPNFMLKQDPTEVGKGMIDWRTLLPAALDAGVEAFYVEQEPPFEIDRLQAITDSYRFLSSIAS